MTYLIPVYTYQIIVDANVYKQYQFNICREPFFNQK